MHPQLTRPETVFGAMSPFYRLSAGQVSDTSEPDPVSNPDEPGSYGDVPPESSSSQDEFLFLLRQTRLWAQPSSMKSEKEDGENRHQRHHQPIAEAVLPPTAPTSHGHLSPPFHPRPDIVGDGHPPRTARPRLLGQAGAVDVDHCPLGQRICQAC